MGEPVESIAGDGPALAREYYRAIDAGDWAALRAVLDPEFTQERGDRTFADRAAFVTFMAENRPETDTEHVVEQVYTGPGGVAVQGRLLLADGSLFFAFVDVFRVEKRLTHLRTYSKTETAVAYPRSPGTEPITPGRRIPARSRRPVRGPR